MLRCKKFLAMFLTIILVLTIFSVLPTLAEETNLIKNAGFETLYDYGDGLMWAETWEPAGTVGSAVGVEYNIVGSSVTAPYSGDYCLQVTKPESAAANVYRAVQEVKGLTPGTTYELTGWIKAASVIDKGASLMVRQGKNSGTIYGNTTVVATQPTFGWYKQYVTFVAPETGSVWVYCMIEGGGTVYFDDISINKQTNYIGNGDFEYLETETKPLSWTLTNTTISLDQTDPKTGKYSIKLTSPGTNHPYVYQRLKTLSVGKAYKFSFWYKSDDISYTDALRFKVDCLKDKTALLSKDVKFNASQQGVWFYKEYCFTVPTETNQVDFYLRTNYAVSCYYDDVKLVEDSKSISFYSGNSKIENITSGEIISKCHFVSNVDASGAQTENVAFLVGVYKNNINGTKTLVELKNVQKAITQGVATDMELAVNVPTSTDPDITYTVESFCLDGFASLKPYLAKAELK